MSNPSRATLITEGSKIIAIIDDLRRYGSTGSSFYPAANATNLITDLNNLQTVYAGDFLDDQEAAVESVRGAIASVLSPGTIASLLRPWLKQFCKSVIGRTNLSNDQEMLQEFFKYNNDNTLYFQSRNFTYGTSVAAAGAVGNGQIVRLNTDRYGYPIESEYVDAKRFICVADENTGTRRGQEVFQAKGQASARDELERSGSGLSGSLTGMTIDDSILVNAGFRSGISSTAPPTGWTYTTGAASSSITLDTTNFFRLGPSDSTTTVGSLSATVSFYLTQKLSVSGKQMSPDIPWLMAVVWNRVPNTGSGTLNCRMGGVTTTVSVSAQTGWNVTLVPSNIPKGFSCWYRQFAPAASTDLQFGVEWIQTSGGINVAEVLVVPGVQSIPGGTWYWALPASVATYAQWRVLDQYSFTDIATGSAKWQNTFHRAYPGFYNPSSNGSSITYTEP